LAYPSEQVLAKYADLIVHVGLNLRAGQRLLLYGAPLESAPLVRAVAASAYDAGSRLVEVNFTDQQITLTRFQHAPRDSFEEFPEHLAEGFERLMKLGGAVLSIYAADPDLLKDQDPALIATAEKAVQKHIMPAMTLLTRNATNWCVVSLPIPSWAAKVFPDLSPDQQMERLWDAILSVCRMDRPDPVGDWKQHVARLAARADYLTAKKIF
jgi:aminopeptidase